MCPLNSIGGKSGQPSRIKYPGMKLSSVSALITFLLISSEISPVQPNSYAQQRVQRDCVVGNGSEGLTKQLPLLLYGT